MKNFIFYPIIFFLYPVFFSFLHNNLDIFYLGLDILIISPIVILLLFLFINKFIRDKHKSGLILGLFIILFYQGFSSSGFIEALFYLFLSLLIVTGLTFFILKTKKDLSKLTTVLNFVAIILIGFTIYSVVRFDNSIKPYKPTKEIVDNIEIAKKSKKFPDIYYIVPDEYAGFESLKSYFNYDNSEFKNFLVEKGFYVFEKPRSNYMVTIFSIPSTFEMGLLDYFKSLSQGKMSVMGKQKFLESNLLTFLKALGYKYVFIMNYWDHSLLNNKAAKDTTLIDCAKETNSKEFLYYNTVLRFLIKPLMLNDAYKELTCQFDNIVKATKFSSPKFVFAHLYFPHKPFLFDKNGKRLFVITTALDLKEYKKMYLDQLQYANVLLKKMVIDILSSSKTKPVIIIQSDHGFRPSVITENNYDLMTNNIIAVYPAEVVNKTFPKKISPVNLYRMLFNSIFNTNFERIPTSQNNDSIYQKEKNMMDKYNSFDK